MYTNSRKILVVRRRDIGVKSLSETETSPVVIKDSKEKQTGDGLNGKFMRQNILFMYHVMGPLWGSIPAAVCRKKDNFVVHI